MESKRTRKPIDGLTRFEVQPYPLWICIIAQVIALLAIGVTIGAIGWLAVQGGTLMSG